jgi:hopene-associated glycosyltransferase HpnB
VPSLVLALVLTSATALSLAGWLTIRLLPARPWDLAPVDDDFPERRAPSRWPTVAAIVPARNEAGSLPLTLPALLAQAYPGELRVVVVDDRSSDGTAEVARRLGSGDPSLAVVDGGPLPDGWAGKVWALEQGVRAAGREPEYLLFTDADIRHSPRSVRRLVAESAADGLALNSRMARLRCESLAERLLIPPFLFLFNLLYPMRLVNDPRSRVFAAAGGCVLVRAEALAQAGGLAAIRGAIIDDINLARVVKRLGAPIRLAVSRDEVVSVREYGSAGPIWRMVRRSAFDQLRYSWLLLAATLAGLFLLFPLPPLVAIAGPVLGATDLVSSGFALALESLGLAAWLMASGIFLPTVRFFGLAPSWALTLPLSGTLYGGMTLDSAWQHLRRRGGWA